MFPSFHWVASDMLCIGEHKLSPEERLLQLRKEERYCCLFSWFIDGTHGTLLIPPGLCSSSSSFLMTSFLQESFIIAWPLFFIQNLSTVFWFAKVVQANSCPNFTTNWTTTAYVVSMCFKVNIHTHYLMIFSCIYIRTILYAHIMPRTVYLICSLSLSQCAHLNATLFWLVLFRLVLYAIFSAQFNITGGESRWNVGPLSPSFFLDHPTVRFLMPWRWQQEFQNVFFRSMQSMAAVVLLRISVGSFPSLQLGFLMLS